MQTPKHVLEFFAQFIQKELGIVYQEANFYQLETRLIEIAKQLEISSVETLVQEVTRGTNPRAKLLVLDVATNNETSFFRDMPMFEAIEKNIINVGFPPHKTSRFKVWSAACSYGQEVYSLAMMFDRLRDKLPGKDYEILATDISDRALDNARAGTYTQLQVQRGLSAMNLVKYFNKADGANKFDWHVKPELKKNLTFRKLNLLDPFLGMGPFDLVLCRNVLIYQTVEKKKEIIGKIYNVLSPDGYLILGAAESMIGISDDFELVRAEKATLFRKKIKAAKAS